ncbi:MAG: sigma 54-interacting transcriptional regulator [Desulfatitalea sp.]|nr:sigma 54-interacting transcriptional regulator [Desulfatitalea sp.]NNJ99131.1 sigma 54-interacting transcriptional regulator [Desulfatitalea sp.]
MAMIRETADSGRGRIKVSEVGRPLNALSMDTIRSCICVPMKFRDKVARMDASVLILGETGVGKELVARAIHGHSPRKNSPFIQVNCSALPETLITSELFGHEKGAFTGAEKRRIGRFELADQGTLFLDEIGDISLEVQVRMLRVLQSKEFERVGGKEVLKSNFRLITATNRDLKAAIHAGKFREDLFYRLNVFPIHVPPLRHRREDIPLLAGYFLEIYSKKAGKEIKMSESDMKKFIGYDWPGNVRELENVIERGAILSSGKRFKMPELHPGKPKVAEEYDPDGLTLREYECQHILQALEKTGGKIYGKAGAAELLDIHPNTLISRVKKLGIVRNPKSWSLRARAKISGE